MRLSVLSIGKTRDDWVSTGIAEYEKRLRPRMPLELIEVKDNQKALLRLSALGPRQIVWALSERGAQLTSVELAQRLQTLRTEAALGLTCVLGGADGLPKEILDRAHFQLGLSRLTLPHRLARLLLVEQMYRALSILHDEPYHRA